jgi:hypothetical protein
MTVPPNTYTINNKLYYSANELKTFDSLFFKGCGTSIRGVVKKHDIPNADHLYAMKLEDNPFVVTSKVLKSKLFLSEEWAKKSLPSLNSNCVYKYDPLPPLIELEDSEKFMDDKGNLYNVETRGERSEDKVFLKAKDIARVFDMKKLTTTTLFNKDYGYSTPLHYKVFSVPPILMNHENASNNSNSGRSTFLTYEGLLKVIYTSRANPIVERFRKWATKVVYTAHLGTQEQREQLSKQIKGGADPESVKNVLKCSVTSTPCIYLFCLGGVKELKENEEFKEALLSHKNSDKVYKYGKSIDLRRRTGEHRRSWSPLEIKLSKYAYIDPQYISKVELELKNYLSDDLECQFLKVQHNNEITNEIVVLSNQQLKLLSDKYVDFSKEFGGCLTDITKTNIELERKLETLNLTHSSEMEKLNHKLELNESKHQVTIKDKDLEVEKERSKSALLEKEIEILNLKLKGLSIH